MYIIIERHTNRHDNIYDAFIVRPVYYNSLEKAILKAKDLFEGCKDRTNFHLIPMDTDDLRDDDHEVAFGIGEFEDGAFDDYCHYFEVVEIRSADEVENEKPNTRISYLYRDADNYKQQNYVIVPGHFTELRRESPLRKRWDERRSFYIIFEKCLRKFASCSNVWYNMIHEKAV